ncbi:lysophospholipase L1-like esterase [Flavobacterium sp. 1]|uniref:SGNH/GDSL hydrolase family protein n=1 Tax=Flavobacterium sp. 1 TaxID=2035200 RepID=UPI000C23AE03|nr:SGNH/GDSL hydrolase family protein [Flavobacterium sp. 1]PJJ07127.1 lysophospholipase L1-like esterase [Flavobacterium sp. 1]
MNYKKKYLLFLLIAISFASIAQKKTETQSLFEYQGRVEKMPDNKAILIGAASSVSFDFIENSCSVSLQSVENHQNYVSIELDGNYIGRVRIEKGEMKTYPIKVSNSKKTHHLSIYKATEAANGGVLFGGTTAKLAESSVSKKKKKIELIGDSITCGFGNDASTIPCGSGDWYDQHNAYWAYGPVLSRALNIDFVLSSVSGYGMYRNWNDEHENEPIIPDVYENLYLNKDSSKPYDFAFQPDLVSICLGTNDLSDGDGKKARLSFNEEKYVSNYIDFIKTVYKHAPNTRIVLLNSPMVSGERNVTLVKCLKKVIQAFENDKTHKPIVLFEFQPMSPKGCGYHPDIADDKVMADQLIPYFKKLLNEMSIPKKL